MGDPSVSTGSATSQREDSAFLKAESNSIPGSSVVNESPSVSVVFNWVVNLICEKYDVEKNQVYIICALSVFLVLSLFITSLTWRHYSPIISNFAIKQSQEKAKKKSDKEKSSEKRKDD